MIYQQRSLRSVMDERIHKTPMARNDRRDARAIFVISFVLVVVLTTLAGVL